MKRDLAKTLIVKDFDSIGSHTHWIRENRVTQHNYKVYPAKLLKLDFQHCRFLKPYHIAPLACLIHEYQQKGFAIRLVKIPRAIQDYFESFNFNQFCHKQEFNNFPTPSDPKTLPLWCIERSASNIYPQQAKQYFEQNHFYGRDLFGLGNALAELMNNVHDHSGSKIPGYTFTQYNTKTQLITTCVCDFGIGIPKRVNDFYKEKGEAQIDNRAALKKALEMKFSTLSKPHNRGFGWDNILSILIKLEGKLLIVSNNVVYVVYPDKSFRETLLEENFPGTLIVVTLDANQLPEKEEELTDELIIL